MMLGNAEEQMCHDEQCQRDNFKEEEILDECITALNGLRDSELSEKEVMKELFDFIIIGEKISLQNALNIIKNKRECSRDEILKQLKVIHLINFDEDLVVSAMKKVKFPEWIKNEIEKAHNEQGWGGLGGELVRAIEDNCDFSFDYRRALTQFRQSIVSPLRSLTRMRPSRRYGFQAMGSRYERKANILIAVDVSGSITDESFEHFYHAINNFFFLGLIEKIDLIFFDVNLKNTKPISFRKKINLENIKGRGGTNFQPAIDFYEENKNNYSGMIIFTDGQGNIPKINVNKTNILWILEGRIAYEQSYKWINQLSGCKATYLPF